MSLDNEEESLTDSEISQHAKDRTFPRLSLPNNLSDGKTIVKVNQSELYRSLLQRTGASNDTISPTQADTTQQHGPDKLSVYKNKPLTKDSENTGCQKLFINSDCFNLCVFVCYRATHNQPMAD